MILCCRQLWISHGSSVQKVNWVLPSQLSTDLSRTLWQTQWAWRCTTGRWSLGRLPGAQVDPSWSKLMLSGSPRLQQCPPQPSCRAPGVTAVTPCRAMPCSARNILKHPVVIHCNKLIVQHLSNQLAKCYENLFLPVDDSEHTLCYPKCLLLFEFDRLRDLRAPMTGVWSWFQYKPNLAWDEMFFNSTSDSAKICWMRNIKPSWGSQPTSKVFKVWIQLWRHSPGLFSARSLRDLYSQYIEHREIRDGSGRHTKASSVWKCTSLKPVAIKQAVLFTEFDWLT